MIRIIDLGDNSEHEAPLRVVDTKNGWAATPTQPSSLKHGSSQRTRGADYYF